MLGNHYFTLKMDSFFDTTFTIDVKENQVHSADIFLLEKNPLAKITLTSNPTGAKIFLNGKDTGEKTPATFNKLQRGNYLFTLKLNLYEDHNVNINVTQNETVERNTKLIIVGSAGRILVKSNPSGAKIQLDDNLTGLVTPDTLVPVSAGQHTIKLSLNGYRDTTITTNVIAGNIIEEVVDLTVYEPRGSITLNSIPQGAQIFLNNSNTGLLTPNKIAKLNAGTYSIKLHFENYYDSTFTVSVIEDQNTNVGTISLVKIPVYTITATPKPSNASTITGSGNYKHGDEVTISTIAKPGFRFVNWTENSVEVSTDNNYTFIAIKDRNLIANHVQIGNLKVNSNPTGANIYLNGKATNKKTPHIFENILAGQYVLTLKLKDFADTTQTILVNRNQTTNVGTIFLSDIVPPVVITLDYKINNDGRLIFLFSFNQDVKLDNLIITIPDGTKLTQSYFGQSVPKGRVLDISYAEKINGTWQFEFFGNKAGGRKVEFKVIKDLLVN